MGGGRGGGGGTQRDLDRAIPCGWDVGRQKKSRLSRLANPYDFISLTSKRALGPRPGSGGGAARGRPGRGNGPCIDSVEVLSDIVAGQRPRPAQRGEVPPPLRAPGRSGRGLDGRLHLFGEARQGEPAEAL